MTASASAFPGSGATDPLTGQGWGTALMIVLAAHAAAIGLAVFWEREAAPLPPVQQAVLLDLPPMAHAASPSPGPSHAMSDAAAPASSRPETLPTPPRPPRETMMPRPMEHPVKPPPSVSDLALRKAQIEPAPKKRTEAPASQQAAETAPVRQGSHGKGRSGDARSAAGRPAAAPSGGPSAAEINAAAAAWRAKVVARINNCKRYPKAAKIMKRTGRPVVAFKVNRAGRVVAVSMRRGTGFRPIDEEALDTIRRAEPLPPPPPELPGSVIDVVVPISFEMS